MSYDVYEELLTESEGKSIFLTGYIAFHIISAFGVPANVLCFFILTRPQMKSSVNYYLQFLSVYDCLFLLFWVAWENSMQTQWLYVSMCAMALGSAYTTVAVSAERFIAICYPLKAKILLSDKRSFWCNLSIVVFIICMNTPAFFKQEYLNVLNEIVLFVEKRFGQRGVQYFQTINGTHSFPLPQDLSTAKVSIWVQLTVWTLIPLLGVTFFNICIFLAVRKAEKNRREMSQAEKKEINLTKTVVAVVVVFFCAWAPWFIFRVIAYNGIVSFRVFVHTQAYAYILMCLNSASNVFIYTFLRKEFRITCLALFRIRKRALRVNTSLTTPT